jgi:hypothetical protein
MDSAESPSDLVEILLAGDNPSVKQWEQVQRHVDSTRDIRAVQRRLRHSSAAFTLERYIHLLDDRAGVDAVGKALDGNSSPRRRR